MALPVLFPDRVHEGQGPGLMYRIEGNLVPALHLSMAGQVPVYFEHHVILWKQPQINVQMMKLKGGFKRMIAGMNIFMTYATGQGEIAFSRDHTGQVFALHLGHGRSLIVREHQFLAASGNLEYGFERVRGIGSMLFGNQGFWVDRFTASQGDGVLWLHAYGNAFEINLAPGEVIDVEPGAWVYREDSVGYSQQVFGLKTGLMGGGGNLVFNRFTGPGRIGLQSGYIQLEGAGGAATTAAGVGVAGAVAKGLLRG